MGTYYITTSSCPSYIPTHSLISSKVLNENERKLVSKLKEKKRIFDQKVKILWFVNQSSLRRMTI